MQLGQTPHEKRNHQYMLKFGATGLLIGAILGVATGQPKSSFITEAQYMHDKKVEHSLSLGCQAYLKNEALENEVLPDSSTSSESVQASSSLCKDYGHATLSEAKYATEHAYNPSDFPVYSSEKSGKRIVREDAILTDVIAGLLVSEGLLAEFVLIGMAIGYAKFPTISYRYNKMGM